MKPEDIQGNLPDEWFEDQGVKLSDSPQAVFIHNGSPMIGLFVRASKLFTAPMAVSHTGKISLVVECEVKGFFQKTVYLILQDKEGEKQALKIPLAALYRGYEDSAGKFFLLVRATSPLLKMMPMPDYMFARNIKLSGHDFAT